MAEVKQDIGGRGPAIYKQKMSCRMREEDILRDTGAGEGLGDTGGHGPAGQSRGETQRGAERRDGRKRQSAESSHAEILKTLNL